MNSIPYGRQMISDADIEAVVSVLRSDYLTQGPQVPAFEEAVASYISVPYAVAVSSATAALHLACLALDLGPGDLLWTSPISFVASANCARYCGAQVDFVDIDPDTYNMCPKILSDKLFKAKKNGNLPKVVVPVHFAGQSCDMPAIALLAKEYGFRVIEDASHAIGSRWLGNYVGNCHHSDISIFSFHPVKIITTGEGGMLTTRDANIAQRVGDLRSHGVTRDIARLQKKNQGAWYYEQKDLGFNYRMTDLQAALGLSQMTKLDYFVSRRHELVTKYEQGLSNMPLVKPWQDPSSYSAFHLYVVQLTDNTKLSRRELFEALRDAGILVNVHYIPVHLQPYYQAMGFKTRDFPNAEDYYSRAISLPLHVGLTDAEQSYIIKTLRDLLR